MNNHCQSVENACRKSRGGAWMCDERGVVAPITAIMLPVLVGSAAIGVEGLLRYMEQRELQYSVDTAVYSAAVIHVGNEQSQDRAREVAYTVARQNGYAPNDTSDSFNENELAFHESDSSDLVEVEIRLETSRRPIFSRLFGNDAFNLSASARAGFRPMGFDTNASGACILGLSQVEPGIEFRGASSTVDLTGCAMVSNSEFYVNASPSVQAFCISRDIPHNILDDDTVCTEGYEQRGEFVDPYDDVIEWPMDPDICDYGPGPLPESGTLASGTHCVSESWSGRGNRSLTGHDVSILLAPGVDMDLRGNFTLTLSAPGNDGDFPGLLIHGPDSLLDLAGTTNFDSGCEGIIGDKVIIRGDADISAECTPDFEMGDGMGGAAGSNEMLVILD